MCIRDSVEAVGPCEVTADNIKQGDDIEILNPEWHIATPVSYTHLSGKPQYYFFLPIVPGMETIAEAKMMGMTPLIFSFRGR